MPLFGPDTKNIDMKIQQAEEVLADMDAVFSRVVSDTEHLSSVPGLKEKLLEGMATPHEDCLPEGEVEW